MFYLNLRNFGYASTTKGAELHNLYSANIESGQHDTLRFYDKRFQLLPSHRTLNY